MQITQRIYLADKIILNKSESNYVDFADLELRYFTIGKIFCIYFRD